MTLNTDNAMDMMLAELTRLKAENDALRARPVAASNGLKVSPKGAVSVYGLGRWPVTLYQEQWVKLFAKQDVINAFIAANSASLKVKGDE